jgi:hypothetical protein
MKHGKEPQFIPVKTALPYNCTNTVPVLPPRMVISSDTCTLWRKAGRVEDQYSNSLVEFGANCLSMRPTDVSFVTESGEPAFRTSELYYDWGVKITVYDCNGNPMATVREEMLHSFGHTARVDYVVELPDGTEIARSMQSSLLGTKFLIFDTQAASLAASPNGDPEPLAYARVEKDDKMARAFCMGGQWRLNVNEYAKGFWADPRSREVLMVMTTVKAVRDVNRDKDGRVTEDRCSEGFWLSVLVMPLLLLSILLCFCWCPASACNVICGCFKRMKYHPV